jgi:FtsP/CotA-like multicopper oxidase with cupredoxin domain
MAHNDRGPVSLLDNTVEERVESTAGNGPTPATTPPPNAARPRPLANQWKSVGGWFRVDGATWVRRLTSPLGALAIVALLVAGLGGYGLGVGFGGAGDATVAPSSSSSSSGDGMSSSGSGAAAQAKVPAATQQVGGQVAKFTLDRDGAKHFTFTAKQVMWEPLKGHPVLAWTLDGTVPGPTIRVTAGDHIRVTIHNTFPMPTAIHWHGLSVPTAADGVSPLGQKPIQPGQTFTYDFPVTDSDVGTHWWHSHFDDVEQMQGGFYGAFIVDPRPGSAQAAQAIKADVEYDAFVGELGGYYVISGKSFPDTQVLNVKHGQTVHMRLYGVSAMLLHPMHLHGHFFNIVAVDGHMLANPIEKDTVQLAPGETFDLTFVANQAPGSVYPFHCHILTHLMNPGQSMTEMGGLIVLVQYAK